MSIMTVKTLKKTFVDFVDFVDPEDSGIESEADATATAEKAGVCTWPVCCVRNPSSPKDEDQESNATRTPENDDANSDPGELQIVVPIEETPCEAGVTPSSAANVVASAEDGTEGLWPDDNDPASPCAISMWQTAAASFYCEVPGTPPGSLDPSPPLAPESAEEQSLLSASTAAQPSARAALLPAAQEAQPLASAADITPAAAYISRLQQLRSAAAMAALASAAGNPPRAFGDATPPRTKLGASAPPYRAGNALMHAASVGPLPAANWVMPQPPQARKVQVAQAAKARGGQWSEGAQRRQGFQREDPNRLERRRHPAKQRADDEQTCPIEPLGERTTIMLRNIPNDYTRDMLHELIETRGFGGKCDFLYLPMDFHTQSNLGYAFVNLERAEDAQSFWDVFEGFSKWAVRSKKVASLRWSECQGSEANIKRYRNSPVMGDTVPDYHKPAIYAGGNRMEFPAPTKPLRAPRIKQVGQLK